MSEDSAYSSGDAIVVPENGAKVNLLFGFLVVMFAAALVRGHLGAETGTGRVAVDALFGTMLAGTIGTWVWLRRYPARLEISNETISFTHRGAKNPQRLLRSTGDLYIRRFGGRHPRPYLCTTGSEEGLLLLMFDHEKVVQACVAQGWLFRS